MLKNCKSTKMYFVPSVIMMVLIFILDITVPLGIAIGALYLLPIFLMFFSRQTKFLYVFSIVSLLLICVGYFISPPGTDPQFHIIANRVISIILVVACSYLFLKYIRIDYQRLLNEKRYQKLYENSIAPMITSRLIDGKVMNINNEAVKVFGYKNRNEVINKVLSTQHYVNAADRELMLKEILSKGEIRDYILKMKKLNGSEVWFEVSFKLFKNEGLLEGVFQDITKRIATENILKKALNEKEILLNEIHHRVKNNLQIIWGLLDLQQNKTQNKEVITSLEDSKIRIKTIGLLHEGLYRTEDYASINYKEYIENLITYLNSIFYRVDKKIIIKNEIENVNFNFDVSIPLSLIISEIISNAFKYAFVNTTEGVLTIKGFKNKLNQYQLIISDNGGGFDTSIDYDSVGIRLIKNLSLQIDAELKITSEPTLGTIYQLLING